MKNSNSKDLAGTVGRRRAPEALPRFDWRRRRVAPSREALARPAGLLDFGARGVEFATRASPHYYNTIEEIDLLVETVAQLSTTY